MSEQKRSPVAALPALLLLVVALWEVCATRRDASAVPDDDAWARAEKIVRAAYRPGDLIVFAPAWVDPVGRMHLGDLISVETAARDDAAPYARIWELSIRGAHAPEVDALTAVEERSDDVTVRRYEQRPAQIVADARELLATAKTESGRATVELAEVGFAPHRCIQVTPAPKQPVKITFAALPLGTELVGYVGLADVFTRRDIRAPGRLTVALDGKQLAEVSPGVDDGWVRFAAPTTPGTGELVVTASADAPQRLICFSIEARK